MTSWVIRLQKEDTMTDITRRRFLGSVCGGMALWAVHLAGLSEESESFRKVRRVRLVESRVDLRFSGV